MNFSWRITKNSIIPTDTGNLLFLYGDQVLAVHHRSWLWSCYLPEHTQSTRLLAIKAQFPVSPYSCSQSRECCEWVAGRMSCQGVQYEWAAFMSLNFACPHSSFMEGAALCPPLAISSDYQGNSSKLSIIRASRVFYIFYFYNPPHTVENGTIVYMGLLGNYMVLVQLGNYMVLVQPFSAPLRNRQRI